MQTGIDQQQEFSDLPWTPLIQERRSCSGTSSPDTRGRDSTGASFSRDPVHDSELQASQSGIMRRKLAAEAVRKSRRTAAFLEEAFQLMTEEDKIQPSIKHVYAALCEAETRAAMLEDWYGRTYRDRSRA